jgi:hypothetical protein
MDTETILIAIDKMYGKKLFFCSSSCSSGNKRLSDQSKLQAAQATTNLHYYAQSKQPNVIVHQILLFGLIFQKASIISNVDTGTPITVLMFVSGK